MSIAEKVLPNGPIVDQRTRNETHMLIADLCYLSPDHCEESSTSSATGSMAMSEDKLGKTADSLQPRFPD
ncbi:hypothetical protein A0H81_00643 [Grifola frondosa]|uniref:Uncharacterized protein n=1 Tax=Grifola frondosa TaxID=5627 RepID=A0A1C7MP50_GRIFR|nr:hypothetical protein A0H81_00643 [Grifola frondosa]